MTRIRRFFTGTLAALAVAVLLTGCVSRATHQRLLDDFNEATRRGDAAEAALAANQASPAIQRLAALQAKHSALLKQLALAKKQVATLQGDKAKLNVTHAEIVTLKGEIARLNTSITQLTTANKKLGSDLALTAKAKAAKEARLLELQITIAKLTGKNPDIVDGMVRITLSSDLVFNSGSATLKASVKDTLTKLAVVLKAEAARVRVSGHTDSVKLVKTAKRWTDNLGLSTERALSVARALQTSGVQKETMFVSGYGPFDPVASNETKEGRRKNRRVEIFITPKGME